jgi:glutamyl-tRNA synthetase
VLRALQAPHIGEDEPIYPGTCRSGTHGCEAGAAGTKAGNARVNWRFRVNDGELISFTDGHFGPRSFAAGKDFGDFIVWRHDNIPSYQLAVVVDDAAMRITEVVRGEDLLKSTARQLLLYRALGLEVRGFFHCPLLRDSAEVRLAKRHDALSLRSVRARGLEPDQIRSAGFKPGPERHSRT